VTGPSGTVTFLLTDIEGSTRLWEAAPQAMQLALERHDAIVRAAINAQGGVVFSTGGDGFAAAFPGAGSALAAAGDAQARLAAEPWPPAAPIRVRMGVHTGETVERDGNYFGSVVNRAARLMAAGHGGQVLCSAATAELARGEAHLVDVGEHRLRDVERPMRVFQLGGGSFPALRSSARVGGNLPRQLTSFVGRRAEVRAVARELSVASLVTVTGVGGVGKTRLALRVAAEVLSEFPDGAWVCELAAAVNETELAEVVAVALGVTRGQQTGLVDAIVEFVRARQLLLILDNCEHLLDAAGALAEAVIAGAPGVRVLATSREGLGVPLERVVPLRSLDVPSEPAAAAGSDAVTLFVERARAVIPDLALDEASLSAIVNVCRRLDGIPLALELAASRVGAMSPAEIAGHLDERFRLLTGGRRGRVERHQTLRAALEWSYSLLTDRERDVFDRLGVFPASFDEAAAIAVTSTADLERWDVIDAMASLVAKSMVGAERAAGTTRYQLLETLRHYARDHLDDLDQWRRRHAEHYAAFATAAGAGLMSAAELTWRPRVHAELDNLRAAVGWALDAPNLEDVATGVRVLDGLLSEALLQLSWGIRTWASPGLSRIEQLDEAQRAVLCAAAAFDAYFLGDVARAGSLGARAVRESETLTPAVIVALYPAVWSALAAGKPAEAVDLLAEAGQLPPSDRATDWIAATLHALSGMIAHRLGDHDTATAEGTRAVTAARQVGSATLLALALSSLSQTLLDQQPDAALTAAEESTRLVEGGAGDVAYSTASQNVALLRADRGDLAGAAEAIRHAVVYDARAGSRVLLAADVVIAAMVLGGRSDGRRPAAMLAGAVDAGVLGHLPVSFTMAHKARYDRAMTEVAAALGPDAYASDWASGAARTYEEVITDAVEQLDRLADD